MGKLGEKLLARRREHHAMCMVHQVMRLLWAATENGGIFISAGGGTANVLAEGISRHCGVTFEEAHHLLNEYGERDWYALFYNKNRAWEVHRFDARTLTKAAAQAVGHY